VSYEIISNVKFVRVKHLLSLIRSELSYFNIQRRWQGFKSGDTNRVRKFFLEVSPPFFRVPLLMGGYVPSLSACDRYTLLSRGPDVDSETTWHSKKCNCLQGYYQ
jgi:hypothetical protein